MKTALLIALSSLALGISAHAFAAGDATKGKAKSVTCAACHGMTGNSTNPEWPKLAGQSESYIVKQLMDFREKRRENASMSPQAANLTDEDMADLAAYFSSQEVTPGEGDVNQVDLGEKVYKGGNNATGVAACSACHGPNGNGNPAAKFPALAGQHATYTKAQLYAFRTQERHNDAGKMMRNIVAKMSDKEIDAVSEYIAGLQR